MRLYLKRALVALLLLMPVLYGAFALTSRPVAPHPYFASGDVLVIAHRGGKGLAPENTLAAFAHSAALGVDVLEMDLRQSSDGALIVLHDRRVDRTTNGQGAADSSRLAQLKRLDAGYHFSPDGQNLSLSRPRGCHPHPRRGIYGLSQHALSHRNQRRLGRVGARFLPHDPALWAKRARHRRFVPFPPLSQLAPSCPQVATAAASSAGLAFVVLHWLRLDAAYHPTSQAFQFPTHVGEIDLIDRRFVARAHAHNVQVHVWTVNDPDAMQHYLALGVDGLITDYPDRLLRILNRQPAEEVPWATQ